MVDTASVIVRVSASDLNRDLAIETESVIVRVSDRDCFLPI